MKAKVIATCTIHNLPASVGSVVEVDANTFRNLVIKGKLAPVDADEPKAKNREDEIQITSRKK